MSKAPRSQGLLTKVRAELKRLADPARAPQMQRYMKSNLPYHGVAMPLVRATCKAQFAQLEFEDRAAWERAVLELWQGALFREERYAAVMLTGVRAAAPFQTMESLALYEKLIVEGAWWDIVDDVASHRLGALLRGHPAAMKKSMRRWSRDANSWKRRSAILCQLGAKEQTDLELLFDCIEPSLSSNEFFLQKAIGWALREYAWTDAKPIERYVREHELSALSKREALKNVSGRRATRIA